MLDLPGGFALTGMGDAMLALLQNGDAHSITAQRIVAHAGVGYATFFRHYPGVDTLLLDAALHPDHEGHSLEAIADRFGLDVLGRHTALGDALLTGEVLVRLLALLQQRGITTLGQALEASRKTQQARLDARLYGS